MSLLSQLRGFLRAFRSGVVEPTDARSSSLARTLKESTHVRGSHGGLARAGTEEHHQIVAEGHEDYTDSFNQDA